METIDKLWTWCETHWQIIAIIGTIAICILNH